jgi:hypothetical protein
LGFGCDRTIPVLPIHLTVISKTELPGHLSLYVLDQIRACGRCASPIRMARKLGTRNTLNRWCAVPASQRPGRYQLPASALHVCHSRHVPIRNNRYGPLS